MVAAGTPDLRASVDIFTSPSASCFDMRDSGSENCDFQLSSPFVRLARVFRVRTVGMGTTQRPSSLSVRVHLGSDHAGFALKTRLIAPLRELGHEPIDCGPTSFEPED